MEHKYTFTQSLDNAEEIIERFGGIRPMATTIDAAVTTVQGWKKRNTIPPHRIERIIIAAEKSGVDLSDLIEIPAPPPAPEPAKEKPASSYYQRPADLPSDSPYKEDADPAPRSNDLPPLPLSGQAQQNQPQSAAREDTAFASILHDDIIYSIQQAERRAVTKSTWTTIILVAVSTLALTLIFGLGDKGMSENDRIAALKEMEAELQSVKNDVDTIKKKQGFFGSVIPEDLNQKVDVLKNKASDAGQAAISLANEAKTISQSLINGPSEEIMGQIAAFEKELDSLGKFPSVASITQRFAAFTATSGGQNLLEQSTSDLSSIVSDLKNPDDKTLEKEIDKARQTSASLNQALEGVPQNDLKAAAMLLTMTQLRSALNRNGEPFDEDLALLQKLVGDDDPALTQSINKLSTHAQNGILTSSGLSNELRSLTGEIVVASLKGEKLSIQDRAKARIQSVLLLEDEGKVTASSDTQQTLSQADKLLQQGDVEGALQAMQNLDGDAAKAAQPWMNKAEASLAARQFKTALSGVLDAKAAGLSGYKATTTLHSGGSQRPIYVQP